MFRSKDLLGQLTASGMAPSSRQRMQHAFGERGLGSSDSPLSDLLSNLTRGSGAGGGTSGQGGGLLEDLAGMAGQVFGSAKRGVQENNPFAVGGLGALAGLLLGGPRGAIGGGVLSLLGSLAYSALNPKAAGSNPDAAEIAKKAPLEMREPQDAAEETQQEQNANIILLAMINAAKADGQVSERESQRITGKLKDSGAEQDGMNYILGELQKPLDMDGFVRQIKTPELAAEVYAASLLAIEVDTEAERDYLRRLGQALNLPADAINRLHAALGVAPV